MNGVVASVKVETIFRLLQNTLFSQNQAIHTRANVMHVRRDDCPVNNLDPKYLYQVYRMWPMADVDRGFEVPLKRSACIFPLRKLCVLAKSSNRTLACWGTQRLLLRSSHSSQSLRHVQDGTMTYHSPTMTSCWLTDKGTTRWFGARSRVDVINDNHHSVNKTLARSQRQLPPTEFVNSHTSNSSLHRNIHQFIIQQPCTLVSSSRFWWDLSSPLQ
jgi:hypothetical protein